MRKLKITELNRISVEEFKEAEKLPLVVVLDNIRSLHNRFRFPYFGCFPHRVHLSLWHYSYPTPSGDAQNSFGSGIYRRLEIC